MPARVLVVDDQPLNLRLLAAKLASEYYEVITASDGLSALDLMQESKPDVVLLDVMMPGLDGFEVCRRMKATPTLAHIPVIMVTALSEPSDRVRGLEAGADDFLTKPINDLALFARLRSLLRLKMLLDELRLRDQTSVQLGVFDDGNIIEEDLAGARILVIEDSAPDADLIAEVLKPEAEVSCLNDASAALTRAEDGEFDLIIISLNLVGCDGLRLCSQLRSRDTTRHAPLLMLVREHDTELMAKGLDLGVNDYLYKPIDRNELITRTRNQIRHKFYQDRLRNSYQRSVSLAVTDSLTGLYNRLYLTSHLSSLIDRAVEEEKPLAVAMVDIDHFKLVNDTHGHPVGDAVLREVAERLNDSVRASDLLARIGGEEFVIVMPETDIDSAHAVNSRLRGSVAAKPFAESYVDGGLELTVSIGVAGMLGSADTSDSLLERSDKALYEAKRGGRNRVIATAS